jgi:cobalamin synthase
LHFDGLADTADGFGGGKNREDTLRIMRDHAIGSYGGVALAALVILKVTAYAALLAQSNWVPAVILTPALGRWSILLLTAALPYARESASAIDGMGKRSLFWGTGVILVALIAARSGRAWFAMAAVVAVTAAFGFYCRRRIAGITGDTLGANLQLCESAALLTFLWARHSG